MCSLLYILCECQPKRFLTCLGWRDLLHLTHLNQDIRRSITNFVRHFVPCKQINIDFTFIRGYYVQRTRPRLRFTEPCGFFFVDIKFMIGFDCQLDYALKTLSRSPLGQLFKDRTINFNNNPNTVMKCDISLSIGPANHKTIKFLLRRMPMFSLGYLHLDFKFFSFTAVSQERLRNLLNTYTTHDVTITTVHPMENMEVFLDGLVTEKLELMLLNVDSKALDAFLGRSFSILSISSGSGPMRYFIDFFRAEALRTEAVSDELSIGYACHSPVEFLQFVNYLQRELSDMKVADHETELSAAYRSLRRLNFRFVDFELGDGFYLEIGRHIEQEQTETRIKEPHELGFIEINVERKRIV